MTMRSRGLGKDDRGQGEGTAGGDDLDRVVIRSHAATAEQRRADEEQQRPRPLEGLSGMVPGTQRRDNLDSRPDFYAEFSDMSAATTEVMDPRHYPEDERDAREEQRELIALSSAPPHPRGRG